MNLAKAFESGAGSVVIIDDLYLLPNPDTVSGEALSELLRALKDKLADCTALAELLGMPGETTPAKLIDAANRDLDKVYTGYLSGKNPYLKPLFSDLDEKRAAGLWRLRMLEEAILRHFKVKPSTFSGLEDAREKLKDCTIAFVDFFLEGVTNHVEARKHHAAVKNELATKFSIGEKRFPKVVALMSTALPGASELAIFRQDTGVRAAFFHALDKNKFTPEGLLKTFGVFTEEYGPAEKLNKYLETMEDEVRAAADGLAQELRSGLDVHDLTILKTLRLDGESDTPQAYLTLLLSEALAARVRMASGLQTEVLPKAQTYGDSPFDGKLLPSSVLFQLFADIAVAPAPTEGELKIAFGDVLQSLEGDEKGRLLLAISPACDLQRCTPNYEVLCVTGALVDSNATLSALFEKKYSFGQGNVVLKNQSEAGETIYSRINFDSKSLRTIRASAFKDSNKYKRLARLTEVFAQEIKTLALNNVARVGVPIDPSFSVGLKAKIRFSLRGDQKGEHEVQGELDVDDSAFLPAVLAMGRELGDNQLQPTVMFSVQFRECVQGLIASEIAKLAEYGRNSKKLEAVSAHFSEAGNFKVVLSSSNFTKTFGQFITIKYIPRLSKIDEVKNFEILLYSELEADKSGTDEAVAVPEK